jgi:DnaJ-class molecular chaperone
MNIQTMIETAAAKHAIEAAELTKALTAHGWDFSAFTGTEDEVKFITGTINHHAGLIEARIKKTEAARAEERASRERRLTPAARAMPALQCGKCDGSGKIRAFSHIENGSCFQCGGTGVIRSRRH